MRYYIFLLIIFLNSCNKQNDNSFVKKVNPRDTFCLKEINEANRDIKNNKLVYCHYVGNIIWNDLRSEKEMKSLLGNYKIDFQNESSPCVIDTRLNYNCYCELMQEKIDNKFGKKFIQNLLNKSDSLWVLKNLDKTFEAGGIYGMWDKCALFPNDKTYSETNHTGLQDEFDKQIKYSNNYKIKSHHYSNATVDATVFVDRNGKALVEDISTNFFDYKTNQQNFNKKFETYFTKRQRILLKTINGRQPKLKV